MLVAGGRLLTKREGEVLPLLQQGRSNAQIALALQVGVETVRTHARNIYRKLGVASRRELAARAGTGLEPEPAQPEHPPRRRVCERSATAATRTWRAQHTLSHPGSAHPEEATVG